MRTYAEIREDESRAVVQAIENAETQLGRATAIRQAGESARQSLEEAVQELLRGQGELDSPGAAIKGEIGDLERRIRDLQRQLEAKRQQQREVGARVEEIAAEVRKRRGEIASADKSLQLASDEIAQRERALQEAQARLAESRIRALRIYCEETFSALQKSSTEATARERFDRLKASYEEARHSDPQIMGAHEERLELRRHLDSAQISSVRELLHQRLASVEGVIRAHFPGFLEGPPPPEDEEVLETFFWYDADDDLTSVLLPVPISCWKTPPEAKTDPRGGLLCAILWSFVQSTPDQVPTVECQNNLVTLEFHGDLTHRIADSLVELRLAAGRKATFMPAQLPVDLKDAIL